MGPYIAIIVGLLVLAGAAALVFFIAKGSDRPRTTVWMCVGLLVMAFIGFVVLNLAATNYTMPVGWVIGIAVAPIVVVVLGLLIGIDVHWKVSRLVALAGLVFAGAILVLGFALAGIGGNWLQPLYWNRAAQIAEANGFTALLPPDEAMITDYLPVEALAEPDKGFSAAYEDFWLQERKGTGASEADLEKLVAPGATPMGEGSGPVPSGGTVTKTTVQGQPAVANEYTTGVGGEEQAKGKPAEGKTSTMIVLVFELDGVDVRMSSESGVTDSGGSWVPFSNLSVEDLVAIAETFEPVK